MLSEPRSWTLARRARMGATYPQLQVGTANDILNVDAAGLKTNEPVSQFSQDTMKLAAFAARQPRG